MEESTLAWLQRFKGEVLNPRQKRILAYARAHGMIFSSTDYQKLGVGRDTAYSEIRDMVTKGIVQAFKKHGKVYKVLELEDQTSSLPGLEWVGEALREKGFFTSAEVKQPPGVSRKKALRLMRELSEEGYFIIVGKGRTARYQPTEKLQSILESRKGSPPN